MSIKSKVYLICNPVTEQYKIGVTKNDVEQRIKQLQTGNGCELHLITFHETENPFYIEKMLHHELQPYNSINEWFEIHDEFNIVTRFKDLCDKYEGIIVQMADNPFFKKMARLK